MNWNTLENLEELDHINAESASQPVLILKHSTRCSISAMALGRLERKWAGKDNEKLKPYLLYLIEHRDVSDEIESRYGVTHQSPQVLIIRNGKCVYHISHSDISYDEMMKVA